MRDSTQISIDSFKTNLFMWEIIITVIVFTAAYFVLKGFKAKENAAKKKNQKYNSGQQP
jgi:hypothetical protein